MLSTVRHGRILRASGDQNFILVSFSNWHCSRALFLRSLVLAEPIFRHPNDISAAVRNFRPADWARLLMLGQIHSHGRTIDAEDLVQEAITRALIGDRRCPSNVEIIAFLAQTMRSIASNERKKRLALISEPLHKALNPDRGEPTAEFADPTANAEEQILLKEQHDSLLVLFADDIAALRVLEGMLDQLKGDALRKYSGLDNQNYQRKRALIRYRINKHYANGELE